MIITLENNSIFSSENVRYNETIDRFISDLLQTKNLGKIGYLPSSFESFFYQRDSFWQGRSKHSQHSVNFFDKLPQYPELGPLEFSLLSFLTNTDSETDIVILTGALGSGKSSLCRHVLDYIKSKTKSFTNRSQFQFPKLGIVEAIDFNDIYDDDDTQKIVEEFQNVLIGKMTALIERIHSEEMFVDNFIQHIRSGDSRFLEFSEYARRVNRQEDLSTPRAKFDFLLDWLQQFGEDKAYRLRLISYILRFIEEVNRAEMTVSLIFIFDNIDQLNDEAQINILGNIFSFSNRIPGARILVPMRITTFGKIKGNGAFSFDKLDNAGAKPISIIKKRLEHFLSNKEVYPLFSNIPKPLADHLVSKIEFVHECLQMNADTERFTSFLSALSGDSIRRGLFLSERFFKNSIIKYDDNDHIQDEFLKALLVGTNSNGKMKNDDRVVCNLIADVDNRNSLIKIRILQIVDFLKQNDLTCTISNIIHTLNQLSDYPIENVLTSINELLFYTKKLISVDGVRRYTDSENLLASLSDIVQITHTGELYLKSLVYNAVYLQNIFCSLEWQLSTTLKGFNYLRLFVEKMNQESERQEVKFLENLINSKRKAAIKDFINRTYDANIIDSRFKLVQDCLYVLLLTDLDELARYFEGDNFDNDKEDRYIRSSIVIDIIAKVSMNIFRILRSKRNIDNNSKKNHKPTLEDWYNFLLLTDLWQNSFFGTKHAQLETSIATYAKELRSDR